MNSLTLPNKLFIVAFFMLIALPYFQLESRFFSEIQLNEKRKKVEKPTPYFSYQSINRFKVTLANFSKYFEDNFGFRDSFIFLYKAFHFKIFNLSLSSSVLLGKDGWLFYDYVIPRKIVLPDEKEIYIDLSLALAYNEMPKVKEAHQAFRKEIISIPDFLGLVPFSDSELYDLKIKLESTEKFFREKNIKFLVVLPPNKQTIYPENLPEWILKIGKNKTRLDQIIQYMNENSHFKIHDYRNVLMENKIKQTLYRKIDTHLNDHGDFLISNEIIQNLNIPRQKKFELHEFKIQDQIFETGDLLDFLGTPGLLSETRTQYRFKNPISKSCGREKTSFGEKYCFQSSDKSLPSLLVYGDSFALNFSKFLQERFKKLTVITSNLEIKEDFLDKEKPDIVIVEKLERFLGQLNQISVVRK